MTVWLGDMPVTVTAVAVSVVTVPTVSTLDGPEGTDDEAAQLHELADHWRVTPEEALRRAAVDGIDMELQIKAHDDEQANPTPRKPGPGGDLDDGIPF